MNGNILGSLFSWIGEVRRWTAIHTCIQQLATVDQDKARLQVIVGNLDSLHNSCGKQQAELINKKTTPDRHMSKKVKRTTPEHAMKSTNQKTHPSKQPNQRM